MRQRATWIRPPRALLGLVLLVASCGGGGHGSTSVAPAALDPSFGVDGVVIGALSGNGDLARDVLVYPDGRIVVAGTADVQGQPDFFVLRLLPDGTPDPAFGFLGMRLIDFGGSDFCSAAALQADGKIVVVGSSNIGAGEDFAVARLDVDGTSDTTFNGTGYFTLDPSGGGSDEANDVIVQPDGKIVVAGVEGIGVDTDVGVLRLDALGVPDATFNGTGYVSHDMGGDDEITAVRRDPSDGSLVVGGSTDIGSTRDFAVCRFSSLGVFDAVFGVRLVDFSVILLDAATDLQLQADGKILLTGVDDGGLPDFAVARLNANGTLDSTYNDVASPTPFNGDGRLSFTFGLPPFGGSERSQRSVLLADGKLLMVGETDAGPGTPDNFAVARVTATGTLDATFSGDGKETYDFSSDVEGAWAAAEDPDGRIVVVGLSAGRICVFRIGG